MSDCLPHHAAIVAGLESGLTAMRIWQDLQQEHSGPVPGGAPSYYSVRLYPTELWTLVRVAEVIARHFGVSYDPSGVWHLLRRMGGSAQKPERRARERDEPAIATWRQRDWPRTEKRATLRQDDRIRR